MHFADIMRATNSFTQLYLHDGTVRGGGGFVECASDVLCVRDPVFTPMWFCLAF